MDELLTAYECADRVVGIRDRRWLITHANFTSAENLTRCAALGVGADLQPAWIWKDTRTLLKVLGPRRMAWFHPYRKWLDAGLTIGGGSDHMIRMDAIESTNPWDPWLGIWVAVTRQAEGAAVLNPDQRLTRVEALPFLHDQQRPPPLRGTRKGLDRAGQARRPDPGRPRSAHLPRGRSANDQGALDDGRRQARFPGKVTRKMNEEHDRALAEAFDGQAERFEVAPVQSNPAALAHLVEFADLPPQSRILDAGCGPGLVSEAFLKAGHSVFGVDLSAEMIARVLGDAVTPTAIARRSFKGRSMTRSPTRRLTRRSRVDVVHHVSDPLNFLDTPARSAATRRHPGRLRPLDRPRPDACRPSPADRA